MLSIRWPEIDRRSFLVGSASLVASVLLPRDSRGATAPTKEFTLVAAPARVPMVGAPYPDTDVWSYNASVTGPEIRVRQGERLQIVIDNQLTQETTINWHGVRVPTAMDGVPHLTQKPIASGEKFTYEFDVPDAGTYWYHPHHHGTVADQIFGGLVGALLVDPPRDRGPDLTVTDDRVLLVTDTTLDDNGQVTPASAMDKMMGRQGELVLVNGQHQPTISAAPGATQRWRIINGCVSRILAIRELDAGVPPRPPGRGNAIREAFNLPPSKRIGDLRKLCEDAIDRGELEERRDAPYYVEFLRDKV